MIDLDDVVVSVLVCKDVGASTACGNGSVAAAVSDLSSTGVSAHYFFNLKVDAKCDVGSVLWMDIQSCVDLESSFSCQSCLCAYYQ